MSVTDVSEDHACAVSVLHDYELVFFFFQAEDGIRDHCVTEFRRVLFRSVRHRGRPLRRAGDHRADRDPRSEEHTSELQSHSDLVCRLLLEKKKTCLQRICPTSWTHLRWRYWPIRPHSSTQLPPAPATPRP